VNKYRYELQAYERQGGFNFLDDDMGACRDPFKDVRIEGRVLSVVIDRCLADKLMSKRFLAFEYTSNPYNPSVEDFMWPLQQRWNNVIAPNRGWHELKLRATSGGALGSIYNGDKWMSPTEGKTYVSPRD